MKFYTPTKRTDVQTVAAGQWRFVLRNGCAIGDFFAHCNPIGKGYIICDSQTGLRIYDEREYTNYAELKRHEAVISKQAREYMNDMPYNQEKYQELKEVHQELTRSI